MFVCLCVLYGVLCDYVCIVSACAVAWVDVVFVCVLCLCVMLHGLFRLWFIAWCCMMGVVVLVCACVMVVCVCVFVCDSFV